MDANEISLVYAVSLVLILLGAAAMLACVCCRCMAVGAPLPPLSPRSRRRPAAVVVVVEAVAVAQPDGGYAVATRTERSPRTAADKKMCDQLQTWEAA